MLWDKKEGVIVNNESSEILRMFNVSFNHLAQNPDMDLYPQDLRAKIDEVRMGWGPWACANCLGESGLHSQPACAVQYCCSGVLRTGVLSTRGPSSMHWQH